jgi:hypothetical protein
VNAFSKETGRLNARKGTLRTLPFALLEHATGRDEWSVCLDPSKYSNFARYAAGVSPKHLSDANAFAFTVAAAGYYHIIVVMETDQPAGVAPQYYYRGLAGEEAYTKIPDVQPPKYS